MPPDLDPDDEWLPREPLPPADRLWRHPSELGSNTSASTGPGLHHGAWPPAEGHRARTAAVAFLLIGAVGALTALWLTRPELHTDAATGGSQSAQRSAHPTTVSLAKGADPGLVDLVAPSVVALEIETGGTWTRATAVWVDDDGTLATVAPAVPHADRIYAIGIDGRRQLASLIGQDDETGISALVAVRTAGRPVLTAGTRPTEGSTAVVVAGAAVDDDQPSTVEQARVADVSERAVVDGTVYHDTLHLDRRLPDDTEGAVLVDHRGSLYGLVIGNAEAGSAVAIPVDTLMETVEDLRDDGEMTRGTLGVHVVDDPSGGATVNGIDEDSPAAVAGIEVGDVITGLDGHQVTDASAFVVGIRTHGPGERVSLTVRRGQSTFETVATLG